MSARALYFMESSREAWRLEAKIDPGAVERQLRWSGLTAGMRALEVGCGTGAVTRVMARMAAPGRAVGLDQSASRLREGRREASRAGLDLSFIEAQAEALPVPAASFDFTFSRFLFEYLPNPPGTLSELVRATRSGGIVAVADLDGQIESIHPLEAEARRDLEAALQVLAGVGFDVRVGRKLHTWFREAGLCDVAVDVAPYQVYAGGVPEREWSNWHTKITSAVEALVRQTGEARRWEELGRRFLEKVRRPETFYYSTMITVRGRVPSPP